MLSLDKYPTTISKPIFGDEMHGDKRVDNVSVYVTVGVGAPDLPMLKSGLREALFIALEPNDSRASIGPYARRFPSMEPVKFDEDYPGYRMVLHGDLIDTEQAWADVEVGKISVDPKEGGGVELKFRCQMRGDRDVLAPIYFAWGREISMTLEPPKAPPLPAEHPDARADDSTQEQLPIGEGAPPEDDPFAGAELPQDAGTNGAATDGPVIDAAAQKSGKRASRRAAH